MSGDLYSCDMCGRHSGNLETCTECMIRVMNFTEHAKRALGWNGAKLVFCDSHGCGRLLAVLQPGNQIRIEHPYCKEHGS